MKEKGEHKNWFDRGYKNGCEFAVDEADYDELAAIYRAGGIPTNWDLFRAEILNKHLGDKRFDFQSYAAGFARACIEFFEKI
ncbi:MAG: hypothetical protein WBY47_14555 [Desulfobacterales bacterium]|jgi:hypothetical protein